MEPQGIQNAEIVAVVNVIVAKNGAVQHTNILRGRRDELTQLQWAQTRSKVLILQLLQMVLSAVICPSASLNYNEDGLLCHATSCTR